YLFLCKNKTQTTLKQPAKQIVTNNDADLLSITYLLWGFLCVGPANDDSYVQNHNVLRSFK
ncbi:MAG: hypothetical protein LBU98_02070, partial [Alistipes sp.]|nr:hypothetical protein [Alistipes sp.]